jgi:hypothetical protein
VRYGTSSTTCSPHQHALPTFEAKIRFTAASFLLCHTVFAKLVTANQGRPALMAGEVALPGYSLRAARSRFAHMRLLNPGLGRLCVQACPKQRTRCALLSRFPVSPFVDKLLRRITPGNPPSQTECGQSTTRCTQSGAPDSISETKQSARFPIMSFELQESISFV